MLGQGLDVYRNSRDGLTFCLHRPDRPGDIVDWGNWEEEA
jgi:hypothetical protein